MLQDSVNVLRQNTRSIVRNGHTSVAGASFAVAVAGQDEEDYWRRGFVRLRPANAYTIKLFAAILFSALQKLTA